VLRRIDIVGFAGIASVVLGLLFFVVGRYYPTHSNIWRDWLLAFVLVIVGSASAVAWLLIRVSGTDLRGPEEQRQLRSKDAEQEPKRATPAA